MIDGITVLNTVEKTVSFETFFGTLIGFCFIAVAIVLFKREGIKCLGGWAGLILGVIFVALAIFTVAPAAPTYEVLIDDSVSFMDFYERYHIVAQRGDIFTIVMK